MSQPWCMSRLSLAPCRADPNRTGPAWESCKAAFTPCISRPGKPSWSRQTWVEASWALISATYPIFNLPINNAIDSKACGWGVRHTPPTSFLTERVTAAEESYFHFGCNFCRMPNAARSCPRWSSYSFAQVDRDCQNLPGELVSFI